MDRSWIRKLRGVALVGLLLNGLGAHWIGLQSFAWAKMVVDRLSSAPLSTVISQVMSGQDPCHVCIVAEGAREAQAPQPHMASLDCVRVAHQPFSELGVIEEQTVISLEPSLILASFITSPPSPPPERAA